MAESVSRDDLQRLVGVELSSAEADALASWYSSFVRAVAAFPTPELRLVEPPLRSVPGPMPR